MVARQAQKAKARETPAWAIRSRYVIAPDGVREAAVLVRGEIGGHIVVHRPPIPALRDDAGPARAHTGTADLG